MQIYNNPKYLLINCPVSFEKYTYNESLLYKAYFTKIQ